VRLYVGFTTHYFFLQLLNAHFSALRLTQQGLLLLCRVYAASQRRRQLNMMPLLFYNRF
jgi:hypothetical protein